jgi:hypothetical protein
MLLSVKKYYISESKIHGRGVFARKNIKKGEVAFIAKGRLTNWEVKDAKTSATGPNWLGISQNLWLNPKKENPLTFMNHSCGPNLGIKGKVSFVALKDIKKGEELTFDYSITEGDTLWHLPYRCNCGSKNCRKTVRSVQFLPKKTFSKYLPYIPRYFQRLYTVEQA